MGTILVLHFVDFMQKKVYSVLELIVIQVFTTVADSISHSISVDDLLTFALYVDMKSDLKLIRVDKDREINHEQIAVLVGLLLSNIPLYSNREVAVASLYALLRTQSQVAESVVLNIYKQQMVSLFATLPDYDAIEKEVHTKINRHTELLKKTFKKIECEHFASWWCNKFSRT